MKLTQWVGAFGTSLVVAASISGCASTPDPAPMMMGAAGAMGTQLQPPLSYTVLSGPDATPGAMPAPAAWNGSTCLTCHGANGEGTVIAPEVRHTPAAYATWVVRNGRVWNGVQTGMLPFPLTSADPVKMPAISDADLVAVIGWLEGQPKPTTGEGLYKDFCGNCHGPKMATGGIVPVSIVGKMATEITMRVRVGEGTDPSMRNGYMPPETVDKLTDAELALIQQYLMAK